MKIFIIGLGNPGDEYIGSRHNVGRDIVDLFRKNHKFPEWTLDKKIQALVSSGKIGKSSIELILPNLYMNKSGLSLKNVITSVKLAHNTVIVYDDLDLSLGNMKISFNRSSGGHRGVESVEKNLKTREFIRLRIGVTPVSSSGKLKKPKGETEVVDFILGKFKKIELDNLKQIYKKATASLEGIATEGLEKSMGKWN